MTNTKLHIYVEMKENETAEKAIVRTNDIISVLTKDLSVQVY